METSDVPIDEVAILKSGIDPSIEVGCFKWSRCEYRLNITCLKPMTYENPLTGRTATLEPGRTMRARATYHAPVWRISEMDCGGGWECLANRRTGRHVRSGDPRLTRDENMRLAASRAVYLLLNQASNLDTTENHDFPVSYVRRQYAMFGIRVTETKNTGSPK